MNLFRKEVKVLNIHVPSFMQKGKLSVKLTHTSITTLQIHVEQAIRACEEFQNN